MKEKTRGCPNPVHMDEQRSRSELGKMLHRARVREGWSLNGLAKACGIYHTRVLRMERGEYRVPEMIIFFRMLRTCRMTPDEQETAIYHALIGSRISLRRLRPETNRAIAKAIRQALIDHELRA